MAAVQRLREAGASGEYYEALLGFKSVLSRRANSRKDRNACVETVVSGIQALLEGARSSETSTVAHVAPAITDVANQLVETVFIAFKAEYDARATEDVRKVALAILPTVDSSLLSGPDSAGSGAWELSCVEVPVSVLAGIVAAFVDRAIRWSRDRGTVRGQFVAAEHASSAFNWLRGNALAVASSSPAPGASEVPPLSPSVSAVDTTQAAQAVQHLVNVHRLPDSVSTRECGSVAEPLAVAVVNWCGVPGMASALPWFATRVGLQLLCVGPVDTARDFCKFVVEVARRAAPPGADEAIAAELTQAPLMQFVPGLVASIDAKSPEVADCLLAHYEKTLAVGDARLPALAQQALTVHKCTAKKVSSGAAGLLGALLGGAAAQ